jgi:hypothetical protein
LSVHVESLWRHDQANKEQVEVAKAGVAKLEAAIKSDKTPPATP